MENDKKTTEQVEEIICTKCGDKVPADNNFCPSCGVELNEDLHCPECNQKYKSDDIFCVNCGTKLKSQNLEANQTYDDANNISEIKCSYCGGTIPAGVTKCSHCGEWLKVENTFSFVRLVLLLGFILSLAAAIAIFSINNVAGIIAFGVFVASMISVWLYILPSWIADVNHHPQHVAIFFVNLLLGWTILGWLITFVWALTGSRK